jgi:hypothetical protein
VFFFKKNSIQPGWWHPPIIPEFGKQRKEDHYFKASLGHINRSRLRMRLWLKKISADKISNMSYGYIP